MTKFVAAEIIVASLLLLIPGIATAQSSSCTWIATPTPHGLCKVNNGTYGDGDACDNGQTCGEGCCSWEFRIKNVWEGCEITRVDICADRDCEADPPAPILPCQTNSDVPNHICDVCPTKPPWPNWGEDPGCPRLYPTTGTLADSSCDSVCRSSCVHLIDTTGGSIPYGSVLTIPVGFTGCTPFTQKCIDVCVTLICSGTTIQLCCRVWLPYCSSPPAGPQGQMPCPPPSTEPERSSP